MKIYLITFLICSTLTYNANCQISISNVSEIEKIKSGTTFIAMKDPDAAEVKEYIDVFRTNWTISKIQFIKYTEVENFLAPGNSFLTITGYDGVTTFTDLYNAGRAYDKSILYSDGHIYLELWTSDESYFERQKRKKKKFNTTDKIQVARVELFTDYQTVSDPDKIYQSQYDDNRHIRNWGPGIVKNYIQTLMSFLDKGEKRKLYSEITNQEELKKLKNQVLYVPQYVLVKFNKFNGDETKQHDPKDIFDDYKLGYNLMPVTELNSKIITDKTGFYYLVYVKSKTDKFVSVVNSLTGEIIYS